MGDYKFSELIYNPFKFDLKKIDLKNAILVVVISNPEKKTIL
jgi:hypothetical protein